MQQNVHAILHTIQRWNNHGLRQPSSEPSFSIMIDLRYIRDPYNKPSNMTTTSTASARALRKQNKKAHKKRQKTLEATRLQSKADSPGVPPNTCPYIDNLINMVTDLQQAYERLREKGEYQPMTDRLSQHARDTLEYVRSCNETLRDNSAFWYNRYKDLLEKQ